jgi:ubiquitin-like-conjugating enzyme ATG10
MFRFTSRCTDSSLTLLKFDGKGLSVRRKVSTFAVVQQHQQITPSSDRNDYEMNEEDNEVITREVKKTSPWQILYDILYSPSYQVPVLYIHFKDFINKDNGSRMPTLEQVYDLLVPDASRPSMQQVSVMGALSLADHPISNMPAYFVHPCRTAEAMASMTEGRSVRPIEYLLIWIGLIGPGVGLNVPVQVAQRIAPPPQWPVK